jgi:hypothetical protein
VCVRCAKTCWHWRLKGPLSNFFQLSCVCKLILASHGQCSDPFLSCKPATLRVVTILWQTTRLPECAPENGNVTYTNKRNVPQNLAVRPQCNVKMTVNRCIHDVNTAGSGRVKTTKASLGIKPDFINAHRRLMPDAPRSLGTMCGSVHNHGFSHPRHTHQPASRLPNARHSYVHFINRLSEGVPVTLLRA